MNELATRFAARLAASPSHTKRYRHIWTQEQNGVTYGDGISTWPAIYELTTSNASSALTVKVLIGARDGGGGFTAEVSTRWEMAIKRVWSDKATVSIKETVNGNVVTHTRRVLFEIGWNHTNAEYSVLCRPTPGMTGLIASVDGELTASARTSRLELMGVPAIKAGTYDVAWPQWRKEALLRDVDRDNVFHGTPNMLEWGAKDSEAVPHEFGHTIGLPDEYDTTRYNGNPVDATIYGQPGFSTKSIMNNTVSNRGSTLYARHFDLIANDYLDLMRTLVKPAGTFTGVPEIKIL
ncbi:MULTISPECIES: immune inhibitor A domain-containing protein [unclassified Dyella]|uniref:immune inhibitor A domain-containing protein n=1 Tax=unclassified Dyella TaxID=2634549 RepID=UPI000C84A46F|nr:MULTISPECIES: immune inhibitor A domain-containing protein [unclassified Dyella]MDR3443677.1 hypothetical protein [Dyella sp.]PMQ03771.1 hypothetical protein DyAD56_17825 [Dyella sp. AD56]